MKTKNFIFLIFVCFGLMFGCEQFEMPDDELTGIDLKKATSQAVFTVEPTGVDDTENLQNAFAEAVAAGPGAIVQLVKGEYFLGFLEIRDFFGTLEGAGKTKTVITVMNNLDAQALWDQNLGHDLIKFVGGNVHLKNFSIETPAGKLCVTGPAKGHIRAMMNFSANNAQYELGNEDRSINVVIDNVSVKGQFFAEGPGVYTNTFNCLFGVRTGWDCVAGSDLPRERINIEITNSEFNTLCYGVLLEAMNESKAVLGKKNNGNLFKNNDKAGGLYECRDTKLLIEGNTFNISAYCYGFDVDDYPYYAILKDEPETKTSLANIQFNVFNLDHADFGLFFRNILSYYWGHIPMAIQVKNNKFNMTDGYEWAIGSLFTDGMVIRNNKFSGHGDLALWIFAYSRNGLALGNNFSTASFETGVAYLAPATDYYPATDNWTFVGGNFNDKVIDLGTNNVFTGMNVSTSDKPLGRSISEKLVPMNHLMK